MNCPDCNSALIILSENDRSITYQCVNCHRLIVEKKD